MTETLLARLHERAGQSLSFGASTVTDDTGLLDPEPDAITRAIPKRRAEFAAGRRAARAALTAADLPSVAIPQGAKRAPVWPEGVVGSITHDTGLALACVASDHAVQGLGIDLAEAIDFPAHLRDQILLTPEEKRQNALSARIIFSAKETVFKAFFPGVGAYFGFDAVEVFPELVSQTFKVTLRRPLGAYPKGFDCEGHMVVVDGRLVTWLALPA